MSNVIRANVLDVSRAPASLRGRRVWRIAWTMFTILVIQGLVCGAALFPVVFIWWQVLALTESSSVPRALAISVIAVPSYVLFALLLMFVSAAIARMLNWRTPANANMRVADVE